GVGRSMKESSDVGRANETVEAVEAQLAALQSQFDADVAGATAECEALGGGVEKLTLRPKKTNITVRAVVLAWVAR
ncbi:MAG: hypothetical protein J0L61_07855, partial [Planctomycetes bacterium]|nr:hypothetical protein [Planctomycetota bacterium]